jgi:hypothetical protein
LIVGPAPILGLSGHSAALIKPLKSSLFRVHPLVASSYSGPGMDGENVAYSWTWVSTVKLLMDETDSRRGEMYSSNADSISQSDGRLVGVKRENVI